VPSGPSSEAVSSVSQENAAEQSLLGVPRMLRLAGMSSQMPAVAEAPPQDRADQSRWLGAVVTIAAKRDRYGIALSKAPQSDLDLPRLDRAHAAAVAWSVCTSRIEHKPHPSRRTRQHRQSVDREQVKPIKICESH
jgi:hypothetical protein